MRFTRKQVDEAAEKARQQGYRRGRRRRFLVSLLLVALSLGIGGAAGVGTILYGDQVVAKVRSLDLSGHDVSR